MNPNSGYVQAGTYPPQGGQQYNPSPMGNNMMGAPNMGGNVGMQNMGAPNMGGNMMGSNMPPPGYTGMPQQGMQNMGAPSMMGNNMMGQNMPPPGYPVNNTMAGQNMGMGGQPNMGMAGQPNMGMGAPNMGGNIMGSSMPQQGMPQQGMPQQGMQGMPQQGMMQGMPQQGMPPQGMPPQGMPQQGMPQAGMPLAPGMIQGPKLTKFFVDIKKRLNRDYIVIMDMSGSMAGQRWEQAKDATMKIAPFACQADPDGITLYLFSDKHVRFEHLQQAAQVQSIFSQQRPNSTTNLAGVLQAAFNEHFSTNRPTTILVITDGAPNSQSDATREIIQAANRLNSDDELSVSFIQIGEDSGACQFLNYLDNSLQQQGAKFDIVDTVPSTALGTMTFDQLIEKSILD